MGNGGGGGYKGAHETHFRTHTLYTHSFGKGRKNIKLYVATQPKVINYAGRFYLQFSYRSIGLRNEIRNACGILYAEEVKQMYSVKVYVLKSQQLQIDYDLCWPATNDQRKSVDIDFCSDYGHIDMAFAECSYNSGVQLKIY